MYVGDWIAGKRNGKGTYVQTEGEWETHIYVGDFKEDKKDGSGVYTFSDGSKFIGKFKDDMKEGKGKYILFDGTTKEVQCALNECYDIE